MMYLEEYGIVFLTDNIDDYMFVGYSKNKKYSLWLARGGTIFAYEEKRKIK